MKKTILMPELMKELHALTFDYTGGEGFDFEPFNEFLSESDTIEWLRAWTGNREIKGSDFLVFGMDGTGGYAAFWCVRPGKQILDQPIIFLGSEGEKKIIARSFSDYLWVLADGYGPCEAVRDEQVSEDLISDFKSFAEKYSTVARKSAKDILDAAKKEFPNFEDYIDKMCR